MSDCITHHPEYFRDHDLTTVRRSLAKRIVGAVLGYAEQSVEGRSGQKPAADKTSLLVGGEVDDENVCDVFAGREDVVSGFIPDVSLSGKSGTGGDSSPQGVPA